MSANLRALGLALLAALALPALAAPAAQGAEGFNWASGTVKLIAEPDPTGSPGVFKTTAGSVECPFASGSATVTGTGGLSVTGENIKYSECTGPFGSSPTVEMHNCHYTFKFGSTSGAAGSMEGTGTVTLEGCEAPGAITVNGNSLCRFTIPEQTVGTVTYKAPSTTGTSDVTVEMNLSNIHYSHEGLCGTGTGTTGTYVGDMTVKGFNSSNVQTSVWVE